MEQIQAIMEAAEETDSPVIVQASRGARAYSQDAYLRHLMLAAVELYPQIPIVMHQDHGNSVDTCQSAIDNGFTSVMMDGSLHEDGKTPADFQYNVRITRQVVELAHPRNVSVEGELGCLGSLETGMGDQEDGHGAEGMLSHDQLLTDPDEAEQFVAETGVDALAVAIGTSHGAYKFSRQPDGEVLAMDRIVEIHKRLPNTHLVMHGSSSVPQELQDIINEFGGEIRQTWGVPVEEIQRGIRHGVRKINVDTDNRMAITGAIRRVLKDTPSEFDPRAYLKPARAAMKQVCIARMTAFGQAGQASRMRQ
jgi:fructose-bisphosphate aldolase class II